MNKADDRISIRMVPTASTERISDHDLTRFSRIVKIPLEKIKDKISRGRSIIIVTRPHPKLEEIINLIKSLGFSVEISPPEKYRLATGSEVIGAPVPSARHPLEQEWNVGDTIENLYEVLDIKYGGMGAVYLVRHRGLNTMMAVKSLLERLRQNEEDRALFLKEAEIWVEIGFHPNIAACYYVRNILESPRIFIEYVDGGSLTTWLSRHHPPEWDLIIDLMVQACDGLDHAHTKGLVHRDVKPGNCLMTKDGVLKVTDFGLTKRSLSGAIDNSPTPVTDSGAISLRSETVTAAGMGTPAYMAPEMWIQGSQVGPQADIYGFGVMLFEVCCGTKPFTIRPGDKRVKLAYAHVKTPPPIPSSLRSDLPIGLEHIILKCLQKRPEMRYSSFREVRADLSAIYRDLTGKKFPRQQPDEVKLLADALNNRAVSLMDLNHYEEAEQTLKKALQSDPHHPEAVYNKGLLEWSKTGNPDYELAIRLEEVVKTPEYVGRGANLLGRCFLRLGDADRALQAAELSISAVGATEEWLKPYAIALSGSGRDAEAIDRLEAYLAEFPNDDEALGWLIGCLARNKRIEEALVRMQGFRKGSEFATWDLDSIAQTFRFSGVTERLVLKGHTGWVTAISHFPKSDLFITAARDRTLKIWEASTGELKKTMPLLSEPPVWLQVSPDERLVALVAAQSNSPVKLLNLDSGRFQGNALAHEGLLSSVAFFPESEQVLTVEQRGVARLWDSRESKAQATYKIPSHIVSSIMFDQSSSPEIILAGMDKVIRRIRPADSHSVVFEQGHRDTITGLAINPDGTRALTSGRDKQVISWDAVSGRILSTFQAHQDQIGAMALSPTGKLAASYDPKTSIKLWDTGTGMVLRTFPTTEGELNCLVFTRDGEALLAGGRDMVAKVWDVGGRPIVPALALSTIRPVTKQMKSERKFKVMVELAQKAMKKGSFGSAYSMLRECQTLPGYERSETVLDLILRIKDRGTRASLHGGWKRKALETKSAVMSADFSPSAIHFLSAHGDHTIRMWSTKTWDCLKVLRGHTNLVTSVRFSSNGREAVSGSDDRSVRIWDLHTGKNLVTLKGHQESVSSVAYSRAGSEVVSGSWDNMVRVWRLSDSVCIKTLRGHDDKVTGVAFAGSANHVVSAGFDGTVKMWDVSSGRVLRDLRGHKDRVTSLRVSPAGDLLLTCSMDGTARIWDLKKGQCTKTIEVNETGVRAGVFSPDQKFLLTGGNDAVLGIWNVETGVCEREFQGHAREISAVEFSSNGRFVLSTSVDGSVMLWELDWDWKFAE
ncbi:MAG TPA: protein kinase [Desulfomonilaceae bacterium]|nr:protein kinase [Desulfomonilaceae bacterium]